MIICGNFGFWDESGEQRYWRKWLSGKPFTTLWVDGNHENYDLLKTYPVEQWRGGKVQFITPDTRTGRCRFLEEKTESGPWMGAVPHQPCVIVEGRDGLR